MDFTTPLEFAHDDCGGFGCDECNGEGIEYKDPREYMKALAEQEEIPVEVAERLWLISSDVNHFYDDCIREYKEGLDLLNDFYKKAKDLNKGSLSEIKHFDPDKEDHGDEAMLCPGFTFEENGETRSIYFHHDSWSVLEGFGPDVMEVGIYEL